MEPQIVNIVKQHDHWKFSVEIKGKAIKGEEQVTVKARSDSGAQDAGQTALAEYNRLNNELKK